MPHRQQTLLLIFRCLVCLLALLWQAAVADDWRYDGVGRVVAVGDVHGAYESLVEILRDARLIDEAGHWEGGRAHLVSLGDLVDRGPQVRRVLDLMMRLQQEAAAAGGRIHVLMGNHEAMHLSGELEYSSEAEYAAFADEEAPEDRAQAYRRFLAREGLEDGEAARARFLEAYPPGYFGHRAAMGPDGRYGAWLLRRPIAVVVNDTLFVHGGLPDTMASVPPAELNTRLGGQVAAYARAWQALVDAGVLHKDIPFAERPAIALAATTEDAGPLREAARVLEATSEAPPFIADGPLWYRGSAWCNGNWEVMRFEAALANFGAVRAAVGHTPTPDARIVSRMDGRLLMIDTGMLEPVYHGRPSALEIAGADVLALYPDAPGGAPVAPEARRVGPRPERLTDDELETVLLEGEVIDIEDVGVGVTRPARVTLRHGDVEVQAVFKTESTDIRGSRSRKRKLINVSDRWQHEVAAYRLDRMIGLDLVPVTVEREINGRQGSLAFWVDGLVSELEREEQDLQATGWCPLSEQWPLMFVFDTLIYNEDRTKQNIVYHRDDWMLYLIDHSRAFRTHDGRPPDIRRVELRLSDLLAGRLAALDMGRLRTGLGGLLEREQIQALLERRDEILEDSRAVK